MEGSDRRCRGAVSGGGKRSQVEGSHSWWRGAVSGLTLAEPQMRTRRRIEAKTGKELPAAAPRQPSRRAEVLSRADEAGAILPSKCQ